jgi:hypothetical protein
MRKVINSLGVDASKHTADTVRTWYAGCGSSAAGRFYWGWQTALKIHVSFIEKKH